MDMKKILQAMDNATSKPVEGANDMTKFLSIIDKNDVSIIKEEINNKGTPLAFFTIHSNTNGMLVKLLILVRI